MWASASDEPGPCLRLMYCIDGRHHPRHRHLHCDYRVESLFRIRIATTTSRRHRVRIEFEFGIHRLPSTSRIEFDSTLTSSRTRWPLWVSTSSFSSIASGRGECRDGYHHETHTCHIYISHTYHTHIYSIGQTSALPAKLGQAVSNVIYLPFTSSWYRPQRGLSCCW
jgi:hypothetical protein